MPYKISWLVENRVMYIRYIGVLSADDLTGYLDESLAMRDQANEANGEGGPLVHTITNATQLERYEFNINAMQRMLSGLRNQRVGWSIFVHPDALERFMASVGQQFAGVRHRELTSMEEALSFLQKQEPDLPPIPMPTPTDTENKG